MTETAAPPSGLRVSSVSFVVPGEPQPWKRPRANSRGGFVKIFNAPEHEAYLVQVRAAAHNAMGTRAPDFGPVSVSIVSFHEIPKSWTKGKKRDAAAGLLDHLIRSDADNIAKIINDGMNGVVFIDDCQVTDLIVAKRYAFEARVAVRVTPKGAIDAR